MNWFKIALNDMHLTLKAKGALFWTFAAPIIFISFFGVMFKAPTGENLSVVIENHDKNETFAKSLAILLAEDKINIIKDTKKNQFSKIVIPENTTVSIIAGKKINIELRVQKEEDFIDRLILFKLQNALMSLMMSLESEQFRSKLTTEELKKLVAISPQIILEEKDMSRNIIKVPYGFQRTVPQYMIMFLLLVLFTHSAAQLVTERITGQMRRLFIAPVASWEIVAGKIFSRVTWSILQMLFIIIVGIIIFHIKWGNSPAALFFMLVIFAVASSAMGIYFSTFFNNPSKCGGLGSLVIMIMSALGGCWWPLDLVPEYMRYAAFIFPTGWALDGVIKIMSFGYSTSGICWHILYLVTISAIFIPLASRGLLKAKDRG